MCREWRVRRRILLLCLFFVFRLFPESFRVQLTGKFFDGGDNPRGRAIDGVADDGVSAFAHGFQDTPAGKSGQCFDSGRSCFRMRISEDQEVGLQAGNFFEADLWPVLFRLDDGNGARETEGIGDEGVLADGDEWLVPDDEEHALGGGRADAALQIGKVTLHAFGNGRACLGRAEHIGQPFRGSYYFIDVVRIGGVGRYSDGLQSLQGLEAVETSYEDDIRMQGRNLLQTWVDGAANFGLFLRVRRIIAVVGVSHEMILQAEGVDGFRQARRERHDALDWTESREAALAAESMLRRSTRANPFTDSL